MESLNITATRRKKRLVFFWQDKLFAFLMRNSMLDIEFSNYLTIARLRLARTVKFNRSRRRHYLFLAGTFLVLPVLAQAETKPVNPYGIDLSGYVEGSYNYLQNSNQFISGTNDRVYDLEPDGFTLQQAAITIAKQPAQGFGGLLNLILGRDANTLAAYGWNPYLGSQTLAIDPTQAFLQYSTGAFTIIGGKYVALAGAEVVNPTQDSNFSRSILFGYAQPTSLMGARGTYALNSQLNLIAGVNNGWDSIRDTSRRPTIELGFSYTPNPLFSFVATGYTGEQRATDRVDSGPTGTRNLLDVVATYNATQHLSFVGNYDIGMQTQSALPDGNIAQAVWQGFAGYVNYKFNNQWRASLRGEDFDDRNGYRTGVVQNWKELTLTVGYSPIKDFELRAETRHDFSNVDSFVDPNGVSVRSDQQSYALEATYKF